MTLLALLLIGWSIGLWWLLIWAAGNIAKAKGRTFSNWATLAALYGIVAVITVALMPPEKP